MRLAVLRASRSGSSPQARGTRYDAGRCLVTARFIPAGAGNTLSYRPVSRIIPVHPRRRGEHRNPTIPAPAYNGSSPQARGTLSPGGTSKLYPRFIPAGAGNTRATGATCASRTVHPRRRGEHAHRRHGTNPAAGSSPQARGTHICQPLDCRDSRFIPAGAGNTHMSETGAIRQPVHPRRRGEHSRLATRARGDHGSSPQARGTPRPYTPQTPDKRFIPAGAGNTHVYRQRPRMPTVHPRRRGEHAWKL